MRPWRSSRRSARSPIRSAVCSGSTDLLESGVRKGRDPSAHHGFRLKASAVRPTGQRARTEMGRPCVNIGPKQEVFTALELIRIAGAWCRRRLADVVDWFRRRKGGPSDDVGRTEQLEAEPADGFSEAGIREALRDVRDPEIGRDLVSLNMIRGIEIEGSNVT